VKTRPRLDRALVAAGLASSRSRAHPTSFAAVLRLPEPRLARGLNLEDTRLVTPRKLALLLGIVALAVAWAARTAALLVGRKTPARKAHGYLAKSWFRIGFDQVRRLLRHDPPAAIAPWLTFAPSTAKSSRVV